MAKKQKKKRNKKYRPNYTTGGRVDMRTGGRVGYQRGGLRRRPVDIEDRPMSIEREEEIRPTVQPAVAPKDVAPITETKPVQPTSTFTQAPTTGKGSDQMFIGRTDQETRIPQPAQAQVSGRRKQLEDLGYDEADIRDILERDEIRARERGRDRDERAREQAQAQATAVNVEDTGSPMSREDFFEQYGSYTGSPRGSAGAKARNNFNAARQKAYEDYLRSFSFDSNNNLSNSITGDQQQFEDERGQRIIQSGRTAQDIAAGNIPTGTIAKADVEDISMEGTTADTVQMDATTPAQATTIDQTAPEQVATMEAATAQTPEELQASRMTAAQVDTQSQVDAAQGEVSEGAIAQAAGVDRVSPIEGAEVEIPEGALASRVVGSISEGAKSRAAVNAGTSLSRITRAKKQLSRAGLSDADIQEIGNDPEALEDRLADFSEEERGIIEGLPEEALVSTQLNGLLEGMENGEIPPWAKPAVASVEAMLARRGLSASSVGRDNLFNAIIQSAMPIAQSNAQAIQQSVSQQKSIEAQTAEANAQRMQQTALSNAQNVFQMDMAQFTADQQTELTNSKFLQTVGLTEANNDQQATIQNAVLMSQANITEANFNQQAQIQNAKNFLAIDMANLNNQQQANILQAQQTQQRLLSNQASENASRQFNATSENQTQQFMASLNAQIEQYNTSQLNASRQFNTNSQNAAAARDANRVADVNKANAAILNQVSQFNAQLDFNREQWNSQNEQAVIQSNVTWRRQANTANTAAQNAVNQQNAQNAFSLTSAAQSFLWQELRDQADYDFRFADNEANRKAQLLIAAIGNEGENAKNWSTNLQSVTNIIDKMFSGE